MSISKNLRTLKTNFESADRLEKNSLLNGLANKWSKYVHRLFLNIIFCKNFEQDFLVSRAKSKWYNPVPKQSTEYQYYKHTEVSLPVWLNK